MATAIIRTTRLDLHPLTPEMLEEFLNWPARGSLNVGFQVPEQAEMSADLIRLRLKMLHQDPHLQPWSLRAIVLRLENFMVGHIGFHAAPGAEYLKLYAPGGVEFGYSVFPGYRRRGYAREAAQGLIHWAYWERHITRFVVSISPDNLASQKLARGLGFKKVGQAIDPVDGPEDILLLDLPPPSVRSQSPAAG